jgi:glycine cleavage system regulatory protein
VRVNVCDKTGVLAQLAELFHQCDISIHSMVQNGSKQNESKEDHVNLIFITHHTPSTDIQSLYEKLAHHDTVLEQPVLLSILDEV